MMREKEERTAFFFSSPLQSQVDTLQGDDKRLIRKLRQDARDYERALKEINCIGAVVLRCRRVFFFLFVFHTNIL